MSFPSAFPPSDIRELAEEQNEFYRATKADYIARGELLTLALFDCVLETSPGSFDEVKRLVNGYALGEIALSEMHRRIMVICIEAGADCGGSNWPLKVFRHEFYLLLGGLSTAQRDAAIFYHDTWRKNFMQKSIPLPQSEPSTPSLSARAEAPQPPSIKLERANAVAAASRSEALAPSTEWDGQIQAGWAPYVSTVTSHFEDPSFANLFLQAVETVATEAQPAAQPEWVRRPAYNHFRWPSPLPRLVALEAGLTTNKRCKHTDAIALIAKRLKCTPEAFCEMSRGEVSERLFGKPNWSPAWFTGVRKLLAQTSRYY
jgi:hypothetical protein